MLSKIFSFEGGWFGKEENSSGALCAKIGCDAADYMQFSGTPEP